MRSGSSQYRVWFFLLIIFIVIWHKPILKTYLILDYGKEIVNYSRANGVNPALVSAVIFVESHFNPKAESHKGALGLMQVLPSTGDWVVNQMSGEASTDLDLLDPQQNLKVGTWYLGYLKRYFNQNDYLALASYNAGHRYVLEWVAQGVWDGNSVRIEQIPFPETKEYLLKVLFFKKLYRYLYPEFLSGHQGY